MARRPAGGGTEAVWASSQGRSGGRQRAGGRVLRQVRKSAGGGAPGFQAKASLGDHRAGSGYAFGCRNPLGGAVGFQAKASLGDHRAGSGYAFGCRNPLGGAVVGRTAIGYA
uniref:Uncharacterized protein n=1 Tax=Oryza meridionalis TaxID=40149 RepID=A0A0E0CYR6_9ORYZ